MALPNPRPTVVHERVQVLYAWGWTRSIFSCVNEMYALLVQTLLVNCIRALVTKGAPALRAYVRCRNGQAGVAVCQVDLERVVHGLYFGVLASLSGEGFDGAHWGVLRRRFYTPSNRAEEMKS